MQNALIKKKLEEQRENFRKRQDQQQQQQQQQQQIQQRASSPVNSPAKQTASPLAFTPTSVLRKMTADKEPDGANQFHQVETIPSITITNSEDTNHSSMSQCQNNKQILTTSSINLSKFPNSVNQVQNETLKMIFLHSAIINCTNNNVVFSMKESALKIKHSCSIQQEQDTDNNLNINIMKENVLLDVNKNANNENDIEAKKSNVVDVDKDANNNCVSPNEVLKVSSERLIDEHDDNLTTSAASDEIKNIDLQNATSLAIHKNI